MFESKIGGKEGLRKLAGVVVFSPKIENTIYKPVKTDGVSKSECEK